MQMEQREPMKAIIEVGKRIVADLKANDSENILSSWMAHYIAELMYEVEHSEGDARSKKGDRLRDTILSLWSYRYELPEGARPFSDWEPILRSLESLDPENKNYRYFSPDRAPNKHAKESEGVDRWRP